MSLCAKSNLEWILTEQVSSLFIFFFQIVFFFSATRECHDENVVPADWYGNFRNTNMNLCGFNIKLVLHSHHSRNHLTNTYLCEINFEKKNEIKLFFRNT